MKKQLTMFAAAAMLVSFAAAASAAVPTITMTGGLAYAVEYNMLDRTWTDPADGVLNTAANVVFSVTTAGNPNLGTITLDHSLNGALGATITGTVKGYDLALGSVDANWDLMSGNTGNPGAKIAKTVGGTSFTFATTAAGADVVNAGRVSTTIGKAAVYGGLVLDPTWDGLAYVGASSKVGLADVTARAGKLIGVTGSPAAFFGKVAMPVGAINLVAKVAAAKDTYAYAHIDSADTASGADSTEMEKLGWVATQADRNNGKPNVFVQGNLTVNPNVAPYASFDLSANGAYVLKAGTSYKTMYVNDAYVSLADAAGSTTTEFYAGFGKGIVTAFVGYKLVGAAISGDTQAEVRVTKGLDWLTTFGAVGKAYGSTKPYIKAGASASVSF